MKEYEVEIGGLAHTFLLDDDDAKLRDVKPVKRAESKDAPAPENKARDAKNKGA